MPLFRKKEKGLLKRTADPYITAETVKNRWLEEARNRGYDWAQNYIQGIQNPNTSGWDRLALWYEALLPRVPDIISVFDRIKQDYKARLYGRLGVAPRRRPVEVLAR